MIKYLLLTFSILLIGCNTSEEKRHTYFGGKIINPKGDFVTISNQNGVIDTIMLKEDNTFLGKLENIKTGLYRFNHGPEYQYLFLEPKDSLLIRLNTWDFDESLVFSGSNAHRNNMLIETFLQNEKDEKNFSKLYNLNYENFQNKIDSLKLIKESLNKRFITNHQETSKDFLQILKIANIYPVYRKIESFSIKNAKKESPKKITDPNMFKYRTSINTNLDSLMFFSPYNNMVISQIYNDAYLKGYKLNSEDFNTQLLYNVDRKIKNKKIKNQLLRDFTVSHFYSNPCSNIDQKIFKTYFEICSNNDFKNELKLLINDSKFIQKGDRFPSFSLKTIDGALVDISNLLNNKNSVIYFRNTKHSSNDWVASRLNHFIKQNSNTSFLVINIDDDKNYIKKLDKKHQYYLTKESKAHNFLKSKFSRLILVNDNGFIENGFAGLSSEKIDDQIADLHKN